MKEIAGPTKLNERLRATETVETVEMDSIVGFSYLYTEGTNIVLMEPTTFEQTELPTSILGDKAVFLQVCVFAIAASVCRADELQDNMQVLVKHFNGVPIIASLPRDVELVVKVCV